MLLLPGDRHLRGRSVARRLLGASVALWLASGAGSTSWAQGGPITFSVIGDIPYSDSLADRFRTYVAEHNAFSPAEFFVHVGDIQTQSSLCPESSYVRVADILGDLAVPAFVLPGDNEWNDCGDPDAAWALWEMHLLGFEQGFCGTPELEAQPVRPENFAFVRERVLFIGLNLVGGSVHDSVEWELRMQQDADWLEQQLAQTSGQVRSAVVFGHAARDGSRDSFFDRFDAAAAAFTRPILYIHGDGHVWIQDAVWGVPNVSRIQIEQGDPPLEVTVTLDPQNPFVFRRSPWPAGTPALNQPPCVDAGADQVVALGQSAQLEGLVTDDGDPTPAVALAWSQASGPGQAQVVFSDPASATATASFPEPGAYVLRLSVDDGELAASDEIAVFVDSGQPYLEIADASVVEGDAGTRTASFTVDLRSASGAPVRVGYATADQTATGGSDYQAISGTLDFSGATVSRSIAVPVIGDGDLEEVETFLVVLGDPSGAAIADGAATGRILDDDIPLAPVVDSFLPARGPPGTAVSVTGDFRDVQAVSVGGAPAAFTLLSETELELVVPPDARSGPISIANVAGTGLSATAFEVEFPLFVVVIGEGSVSLDPPGEVHVDGTTVRLTPLPAPGWEFLLWGGAADGSATPALIEMAGETLVTARFVEQGSVIRIPWSATIASGSDDAEENVASGSVSLTSGDLELAVDVDGPQTVGLRFAGIGIPQAASILSASVQFTSDEVSTGPAVLALRGEASDDAEPFVETRDDLSRRPTTSASVDWNPPAWSRTQDAGEAQRTPDLAELVQEIVDRPGWAAGHSLVLMLTGSGTRTAESHDGRPDRAPRLDVLAVVDVAAPETPANLRSAAKSETTIGLAWDASTDNLGVAGYRLYGPGGVVELAGTAYLATGLTPDTEYSFQVAAFDAAGNESPPSPPLLVRTLAPDTEPPSTPANLRSPSQTGTSIALAWDAASDDRGVAGYRVYGPGGAVEVAATAWIASGLAPDTEYAFQVTAFDAAGNESLPSALLVVRTLAPDTTPPSTPANLRSPVQTTTRIDLAWDAASGDEGVVGYRLYRARGPVDLVGTSWSETGLVPGREYGFQVAALDAAGNESAPSPVLRVRTDRPPTTPANLRSAAKSETTIGLAWDASTDNLGVAGYRLYGPGGVVELAGTAYLATGLTPDTEYSFQVAAFDAAGNESPPSPPLLVRTLAPDTEPPSTPANLRSPAQSETTIGLAWDASTDDLGVAGYRLYGPGGAADVAGTSYTWTGLSPLTSYEFQVSALDAAGNESARSPILGVSTLGRVPRAWSARVAAGGDDAEENVATGAVSLTSGDLELAVENTIPQTIGLRFRGVAIPQGAPILSASVQFTADEVRSGPVALALRGEAADHAAPFSTTAFDVSARPATSSSLAWSPPDWTAIGAAGAAQRTPDLSALIQEIVDRPGWAAGNALVLVVSGTGTRTAESFEGLPGGAPRLEIVYLGDPDVQPPTTPANLRSPVQTETSIALAWDAASDDFGVVGYRVYGPGGAVDVAGTSYSATGLAPGTEYAFQVSARDEAGNESLPSAPLLVRTIAPDTDPPSTPQNLRSPAQSASRIDLAWDASSDDRGVAGYRVYAPSGPVDVAGTSYSATGLEPLTYYEFQVSAFDLAGNESVPSPVFGVSTTDSVVLLLPVGSGPDDAEENLATGAVNLSNGDLDLAVDGTVSQAVGLRFTGAGIPQGAPIVSASVQFTADEANAGAVALLIRGEAADDAAPFSTAAFGVSGRASTASAVEWSPPDWAAIGAAGAAQRTPDLSALLQEIVDRPGWAPGNALVLVVTGTGKRAAESFNGAPAAAPVLRVEYRVGVAAP
jgi:chitodextrinase